MNAEEVVEYLHGKGIKPTTNRILVVKAMHQEARPLTLSDLENIMPLMDKSSIFRVLTLFQQNDVVHTFEDGRGMLNYELCHHEGVCTHSDGHSHFYCEQCQRSFCLDHTHLPEFHLPEGFSVHSVSLVIKGTCAECAKRGSKAE